MSEMEEDPRIGAFECYRNGWFVRAYATSIVLRRRRNNMRPIFDGIQVGEVVVLSSELIVQGSRMGGAVLEYVMEELSLNDRAIATSL